jgi:hypothetical protein
MYPSLLSQLTTAVKALSVDLEGGVGRQEVRRTVEDDKHSECKKIW